MAKKLGKIEKPSVEDFKEGRKLYYLPLLYIGDNAPSEYAEKYNHYWQEAEKHLAKLEKAGQINKIYHESIFLPGEDGLKAIKKTNKKSYQIVKKRCEMQAELEGLEDKELFYEMTDWQRCLLVVASQKVVRKVSKFYREAQKKRAQAVAEKIDNTLEEDQVGLLLMKEEERKQIEFSSDIHVFLIHPPALEEIYQWQKEQRKNRDQELKD